MFVPAAYSGIRVNDKGYGTAFTACLSAGQAGRAGDRCRNLTGMMIGRPVILSSVEKRLPKRGHCLC